MEHCLGPFLYFLKISVINKGPKSPDLVNIWKFPKTPNIILETALITYLKTNNKWRTSHLPNKSQKNRPIVSICFPYGARFWVWNTFERQSNERSQATPPRHDELRLFTEYDPHAMREYGCAKHTQVFVCCGPIATRQYEKNTKMHCASNPCWELVISRFFPSTYDSSNRLCEQMCPRNWNRNMF